jgi:outer membrane lipoprotein-sorting protein
MRQWFLGLAVAVLATGVAAADEKAEAIVKKGIEAHGGADALNKYKASKYTMKGEVSVAGNDAEFTGDTAHVLPDKFRMKLNLDFMGMKVAVHQVANGDKFKRTVTVGDMVVPADDDAKDEIRFAVVGKQAQTLTPLLDPAKFSIKAADDEDVNGKKAVVVVATPKAIDKEIKLYFDKESSLLVKAGHKGRGPGEGGARVDVYVESYFSDFKKVNGIQVPTKAVQHHDGKKFMTLTMSDHEFLEKLDDKEFAIED